MSRLLIELHPEARKYFYHFLALCVEQKIPLMLVDVGRTPEQQADLYAQGRTKPGPIVTWTLNSLHVMTPERGGYCLAIDVCPYDIFQLYGPDKLKWDDADPVWERLGPLGQQAGLKWGVVDSTGKRKDKGHFEYVGPLYT